MVIKYIKSSPIRHTTLVGDEKGGVVINSPSEGILDHLNRVKKEISTYYELLRKNRNKGIRTS